MIVLTNVNYEYIMSYYPILISNARSNKTRTYSLKIIAEDRSFSKMGDIDEQNIPSQIKQSISEVPPEDMR